MKVARSSAEAKVRSRVLDAAMRVLLENGYEATTMQNVAEAAGVSRRSLFNYFQNKEAMFAAAIEEVWARIPVTEILFETNSLSHPEIGLRLLGREIAAFWQPDASVSLIRLIIRERLRFPFLSRDYLEKGKLPNIKVLASYISEMTARRLLSVVDCELAARQFAGLINEPLGWYRVLGQDAEVTDEHQIKVVDGAVEMFLARYQAR